MPFIYRYIDLEKEECVYVGKVTTYDHYDGLIRRHMEHKRDKWYLEIGDDKLLLQYIEFPSHTDVDILETWLIQYYGDQLKNKAKVGWGAPKIDLYFETLGKWRCFRGNVFQDKEEIRKQMLDLVDNLFKSTEGLTYDMEYGVALLSQKIKEIESDYRKSCKLGRYDLQGDFMAVKEKAER